MPENLTNLERVIAKNPTSSLFARLADACLKNGDVNRAIEVCRQGLRYRPSYVSGHVVLGKGYFAAGMFEEARRVFNKVLHLDPQHTVAIGYLGQIDRTMGWDDLALRNFQKARDLDPLSRSLQRAIDEILTSISNQVGQKLQEEIGTGDPPTGAGVGVASGQVSATETPVDSGEWREDPADRPEREWAPSETQGEKSPPDSPQYPGVSVPDLQDPPQPAPVAVRDDRPPKRQSISRLMDEVLAHVPEEAGASPNAPASPGDLDQPGGEAAISGPGVGSAPGAELLDEIQERVLTRASRGRPANNGAPPARPSKGRARDAGDGKPRGGPVWEDIPIATATLGEIYAGQGFIAQAIAIFEKVLEREPGKARTRERLVTLREQLAASPSE